MVQADLTSEFGTSIQGVECEVWLPDFGRNDPELILRPTAEQYNWIRSLTQSFAHELTFYSKTVADANGNHRVIEAERVFIRHQSHSWSGEMHDQTVYCDPKDLVITEELTRDKDIPTHLTLWITPNELLHPRLKSGRSYEGWIEWERTHQPVFQVEGIGETSFDLHFEWESPNRLTDTRTGHLVGRLILDIPAASATNIAEAVFPHIDDLLLIATLATRTATTCVGFDAIDGKHRSHFFRGRPYPEKAKRWGVNTDGIVPRWKTEEFIRHCYQRYIDSPYREALRGTILSLVPAIPTILESDFLSLFACIEEILAAFKNDNNITKVLPKYQFKQVVKVLSEALDNFDADWLNDKRDDLKKAMGDLNRASFRAVYREFSEALSLDVDHLWPVYKEQKNDPVDLYGVRNRLTHGEPIPHDRIECLHAAFLHLQWTLQRIVCRLLEWPMDDLESQREYLQAAAVNAFIDTDAYRRRLSGSSNE